MNLLKNNAFLKEEKLKKRVSLNLRMVLIIRLDSQLYTLKIINVSPKALRFRILTKIIVKVLEKDANQNI